MNADGTALLDEGIEIYRGPVAEGPKLFKYSGWSYISLPEGGVGNGGQTVLRSRAIRGPYERREVLPAGSPHQGALVELANGDVWLRGTVSGASARLLYSFDGQAFVDTGTSVALRFATWKGARVAVFSYGPSRGFVDADYVHYTLTQ